jgi:hypothetical protein
MFGGTVPTALQEPILGVTQLFDPATRIEDFKRLNESLLVHYLDLVHGMRMAVDNQDERIDAMRKIFENMHHVINLQHKNQALHTVREIVRKNVQKQEELIVWLEKKCEEAERLLAEDADDNDDDGEARQQDGAAGKRLKVEPE